ncbi:Superoxide dismutase [Mn], mitochondrial [Erysiphe necator]|uniref:Superoxide dismutase n=1 Tax=Uncinula necator TaxID=52586 RepID=A0A0B1P7Q5_UNCNE|nr:Superoxide dismutase [Mn], mitochondrial [Erysiphe necator]KHJ33360.1 putative manganese superoxide dismutase [Erysiphe necator]
MSAILRNSMINSGRRARALGNHAFRANKIFARGKVTLPDLPYDYAALEPSISGHIMEIHHKNHHQTYVNNLNIFTEQLETAIAKQDVSKQTNLLSSIKFNGGGHMNHSLFWESLAPSNRGGGGEPAGKLKLAIEQTFKSFPDFKTSLNSALAGIQGSGWGWLLQNRQTGQLSISTYPNQDPVEPTFVPLLGIDAWEHAYYLQYQNRKVEYFSRIWDVINWKKVEERML